MCKNFCLFFINIYLLFIFILINLIIYYFHMNNYNIVEILIFCYISDMIILIILIINIIKTIRAIKAIRIKKEQIIINEKNFIIMIEQNL